MEHTDYIFGLVIGAFVMYAWMWGYAQKMANNAFRKGITFAVDLLERECPNCGAKMDLEG